MRQALVGFVLLTGLAARGDPTLGPVVQFGVGSPQLHAAGDQTQPQLALLANGNLLLVYLDFSAHPSFGDVKAALIEPGSFLVTRRWEQVTAADEAALSLACDAVGCVLAWETYWGSPFSEVWLQRFDAAGTPVGVPQAVASAGNHVDPAVAISNDGTRVAYVHRSTSSLSTSVFNRLGALVSGAMVSAPGVLTRPKVAPVGDDFVVVLAHQQATNTLEAFRLSRDGAVGSRRVITDNSVHTIVPTIMGGADGGFVSAALSGLSAYGAIKVWSVDGSGLAGPQSVVRPMSCFGRPQVQPHPATGVFTLYAEETVAPYFHQLHLAHVDSAGTSNSLGQLSGAATRVANDANHDVAAFAPFDAGVFWLVATDVLNSDVDLRIGALSTSPAAWDPVDGRPFLSSAIPQTEPFAVSAADGGFWSVWREATFGLPRLVASRLSPEGQRDAMLMLDASPIELAVGAHPSGMVLAWTKFWGTANDVDIARVTESGFGPVTTVFPRDFVSPEGVAVVDTPATTWVVVSANVGGRAVYGVSVPHDGGAPGAPVRWFTPPNPPADLAVARGASVLFLAWTSGTALYGARVSFDGVPLDPLDAGALSAGSAVRPSVGSSGDDFLVAWTNDLSDSVAMRSVSGQTGRPTGLATTLVSSNVTVSREVVAPHVVFDGEQYLVTADPQFRDGGTRAELFVVNRDGGVAARRVLDATESQEFAATLATDGRGRSLAVWNGYRPVEQALEVRARVLTQVPVGGVCFSPGDCVSGVCVLGQCCIGVGNCPGADGGADASVGVDPDAGAADGGSPDSGVGDAGAFDAGTADSGVGDAGAFDAGTADSGVGDAGAFDAGTADSGVGDAGVLDAGNSDAGTLESDAGQLDAGSGDAGTDGGVDSELGVYRVGCSCSSGVEALATACLVLVLRRRVTRVRSTSVARRAQRD